MSAMTSFHSKSATTWLANTKHLSGAYAAAFRQFQSLSIVPSYFLMNFLKGRGL